MSDMEIVPMNRRLAAILAADVVGYSRLMAEDEAGTLSALTRHRENTFNPAVARHGGRIVKLMGDGTLVEFTSVVDAVNCAMAIQQPANGAGQDPEIILRIGINLGDIIIQADDIYGDGVNIAARLEPLAQPGGICISSIVNESVGRRSEVIFTDGGEVQVKNIDRPIKVWHWHPGDRPAARTAVAPAAQPVIETREMASIAVLPFDNMSDDPGQEYFSDGISEDIITDLSKVSGLLVIARNSSFAYKGRQVDLRSVGRELGVKSILEGSVRKAGNRVRITAQLIDAATGGHIWADRFDRDLTDIFAVQDEVTLEIVNALKVRLSPAEKAIISGVGTTNIEAHDNYLRARSLLMSPNISYDLLLRVVQHAERAAELDPDYAMAFSIQALGHVMDYSNRWSQDAPDHVLARAASLAARGTELDPDNPETQTILAVVARFQGNLDKALSCVDRALSLSPDNSMARLSRGEISVYSGRPEDSIPDLERALRLDPGFRHQILQYLGTAHLFLGNFETAALVFQERILLVKNTDVGRAMLAATLGHLGDVTQARQVWRDLMKINPNYSIQRHLERMQFPGVPKNDRVSEGLAKAGLPA
jgi:adenylate cyclase